MTMRRIGSLAVVLGLVLASGRPAVWAQAKTETAASDPTKDYAATYRLTYTLTEMDEGKRVGLQRFAMTVTPPDVGTVKVGSRVPIVTGTYNASPASANTQFTYLDVGVNIRAQLMQFANGMKLATKIERSSVAELMSEGMKQPLETIHEPVIRQALLENTALLQLGKPTMLGSLDTPGSVRHVDVEVLLELVK